MKTRLLHSPPCVGHYGLSLKAMQEIKESLHELYAFVACEDPLGLARPLQLDVLLYAAKDTMKAELSNFKTCLLANPKLPILLFNERNDTEQLVELLRAGASDFIAPPFKEHALRKVLSRILRSQHRSLHLLPNLDMRADEVDSEADKNRRQAYRARVLPNLSPKVYFLNPKISETMDIHDISIFSEHSAGGMLLKCETTATNEFLLDFQNQSETLEVLVDFSSRFGIRRATVQIVRANKRDRAQHCAIRYQPSDFDDAQAFQRFWMLCQQQQRQEQLEFYRYNFA